MTEYDPRPRIPHNRFYLLTHRWLIAMNLAVRAKRLAISVRTLLSPHLYIFKKLVALTAKFMLLRFVLSVTVPLHHERYNLQFLFLVHSNTPSPSA